MLRYLGCLIIITGMALIGRFISISIGNRLDEVKYNMNKLKKSASDYEFFGMNINCLLEKHKHFSKEDTMIFEQANKIKNIDELNELIAKTEEHYRLLKEKNEWLRKNSIILCVLIGIAIITLLY